MSVASRYSSLYSCGEQISQKSRNHLKNLSVRWVTWSKFHIEGPNILCATVQNLVARVTQRPGFVRKLTMYVLTRGFVWNATSKNTGTCSAAPWPSHRLCYRPAVFFYILRLIALALPQRNRCGFKSVFDFFKLLTSGSVCRSVLC